MKRSIAGMSAAGVGGFLLCFLMLVVTSGTSGGRMSLAADIINENLLTFRYWALSKDVDRYVSLPRCSANEPPPCSDQSVVNAIAKESYDAGALVRASQNMVHSQEFIPERFKQEFLKIARAHVTRLSELIPPVVDGWSY